MRFPAAILLVLSFSAGCSPFEEYENRPPNDADAAADPCLGFDEAPSADADLDLVFVFSGVVPIDPDDPTAGVGLDLDDTCSFEENEGSCVPPVAFRGDGPDCRDAALGDMFHPSSNQDALEEGNREVERGWLTSALRIRGYNGTTDDPEVIVSLYAVSTSEDGEEHDLRPPRWDGEDVWNVGSLTLDPETPSDARCALDAKARYVDEAAEVRSGVLTARPNGHRVSWGLLLRVRLRARLERDGQHGPWRLRDGELGGAFAVAEIARQSLRATDTSAPLVCPGEPAYEAGLEVLCLQADLSVTHPDDDNALCDAVSFGIGFNAEPAKLGHIVWIPEDPTCAESGVDQPDPGTICRDID